MCIQQKPLGSRVQSFTLSFSGGCFLMSFQKKGKSMMPWGWVGRYFHKRKDTLLITECVGVTSGEICPTLRNSSWLYLCEWICSSLSGKNQYIS